VCAAYLLLAGHHPQHPLLSGSDGPAAGAGGRGQHSGHTGQDHQQPAVTAPIQCDQPFLAKCRSAASLGWLVGWVGGDWRGKAGDVFKQVLHACRFPNVPSCGPRAGSRRNRGSHRPAPCSSPLLLQVVFDLHITDRPPLSAPAGPPVVSPAAERLQPHRHGQRDHPSVLLHH
jgi:hypothetical protein